jgi:hypothetical protein
MAVRAGRGHRRERRRLCCAVAIRHLRRTGSASWRFHEASTCGSEPSSRRRCSDSELPPALTGRVAPLIRANGCCGSNSGVVVRRVHCRLSAHLPSLPPIPAKSALPTESGSSGSADRAGLRALFRPSYRSNGRAHGADAKVDRSTDACDRRVDRPTTIRRKRQLALRAG